MKKNFISGVIVGGLVFGAAGAFAGQYVATENYFPVKLNGEQIPLIGYNIEGSTYFKLRDIADKVGGFTVGFDNNTIILKTSTSDLTSSSPSAVKSTQSDYTSNPLYIAALQQINENYKEKCDDIDRRYERTISSNDSFRELYNKNLEEAERKLSEEKDLADIYENAVTNEGKSEYKRIQSNISKLENNISLYENKISRLDDLDEDAANQRDKSKHLAQQEYNQSIANLNEQYQ